MGSEEQLRLYLYSGNTTVSKPHRSARPAAAATEEKYGTSPQPRCLPHYQKAREEARYPARFRRCGLGTRGSFGVTGISRGGVFFGRIAACFASASLTYVLLTGSRVRGPESCLNGLARMRASWWMNVVDRHGAKGTTAHRMMASGCGLRAGLSVLDRIGAKATAEAPRAPR